MEHRPGSPAMRCRPADVHNERRSTMADCYELRLVRNQLERQRKMMEGMLALGFGGEKEQLLRGIVDTLRRAEKAAEPPHVMTADEEAVPWDGR